MYNNQQNNIPKSIIKGSGIVSADLNSLNGRGEILFINPKCFVVGLDDIPYMLLTTPEFIKESLPPRIKNEIYEIRKLVLKPSYFVDFPTNIFCKIPKWLTEFKNLEYLHFQYVELDDLDHLEGLSIQHLVFENVNYNDDKRVISAIKRFKQLKEVSYDQSVSIYLRNSIKRLNLKLTPIID